MATIAPGDLRREDSCITLETTTESDDRVEADRVVFARSASIRRLSSATIRKESFRISSLLFGGTSTPQLPASSPLRRPSTAAATTHSRVHQALRENDSSFEYSNKDATLDGLCYSSRFPIKEITSRGVVHSSVSSSTLLRKGNSTSVTDNPNTQTSTDNQNPTAIENGDTPVENMSKMDIQARKREMRRQLLAQRARSASPSLMSSSSELTIKPAVPVVDEAAFTLRKRRCAKTFEDMIAVRLKPQDGAGNTKNDSSSTGCFDPRVTGTQSPRVESGIGKLLEHGIIQSVLALSTSLDAATQAHCCRALYYLSRVRAARKAMITHGVVASLKQLARTTPPVPRQDMAATLCHLSEEENAVEALFVEGIDRSLLRLITSPSWETKRICALAVFNLSADAQHIKHYREVFSQLLIAAAKSNAGIGGSSLLNPSALSELTSSSAYLIKATYNASLVTMFHSALLGENIPRFIATHLPMVPPAIQGWALRAFVSLCEVRTNRQILLSCPFCQILETMLLSPNEEIQEITLLVILQLSMDEGSRIKICNWLPIGSLIQTTSQHIENAVTVTNAAQVGKRSNFDQAPGEKHGNILIYLHSCILRNLCDSVLTHHELIQEGTVLVLLEMSRMTESAVKVNAICSLCYLISTSTEEVAIHIPELTGLLLTLTESSNAQDCVFAVEALYNISCCDDCVPLLCDSGALQDRLLQLAADPLHKKVAELVAAIVYRLAGMVSCAPELLRRGFLSQLVHLIRQYPTCRAYALNALFLLARNGGEDFPHGGDEMAQLVLALLSNGTELEKAAKMFIKPSSPVARLMKRKTNLDISRGDPATIRSGATLLAHLAHHPKNRGALVRNGAVFRFLKKLNRLQTKTKPTENIGESGGEVEDDDPGQDSEDDTILTNCAFVYYCLTATQEGCEFLVKERGVEDLINLSRIRTKHTGAQAGTGDGGAAYTMKELCTLALCRLSSFEGLESRLIEQGAIQAVMVLALVATDSITIKALCIMTLANCLVDVTPHCLQSLIGHGIIWALSSLCTVQYPEISYVCAVSLCNLSAHSSKVPKFLDAGAPRALIYLLSHSGGADANEDAAIVLVTVKTIANLVANEKLCQAFLNEGLEKHLSVHFSSPESSEELRQLAAMVLLRVTSANDALISPERMKLTMLLWMEQIIDMKDEDLVRNCMLTVHDLTSNSSLDVAELDAPHVLRILVQVFQRHHTRNTQIVTLCLSVLYNMSCQFLALPMIVQSEIMPFLRQQVPLTETTLAAQRRKNAGNPTTPVHQATSSINAANLSVNVQLCCLVLHNLSCCRPADGENVLAALVSCHAVATLHDIYFGRFSGLKEIAAVAICNVAVGKVNSARVLDDHASRVLLHFIRSEEFAPKHYRLVAATLRKLSNAPGNQTYLLNARIASAMVFILTLPDMDSVASSNIMAALRHFSSCQVHISRLLNDGVLPCVVKLADQPNTTAEVVSSCFELISNLCSIDFQEYVKDCPEINVIGTLSKLSDHHKQSHHQQHVMQQAHQEATTSLDSYCARGEGCALSVPELITNLMKSATFTTGAAKKTLQIKANYTVPARKWSPQAQPKPKDPPALACNEIPPTDNGHIISTAVKQRIGVFTPLPKESLVRDERNDAMAASPFSTPNRSILARRSSERGFGVSGLRSRPRDTSVVGARKVLQRGHESRHLQGWPHRSSTTATD